MPSKNKQANKQTNKQTNNQNDDDVLRITLCMGKDISFLFLLPFSRYAFIL
jgi:hypothetical protein